MRISDWSSDVCSSDLIAGVGNVFLTRCPHPHARPEAGPFLFHPLFRIVALLGNDPGAVVDERGLGFVAVFGRIRVDGPRQAIVIAVVVEHQSLRSEEHTSELQSLMRISYAVFCLKKKTETQSSTTS